ncbi:ABC transporter ATP-binding protein [Pseudidiomarina salilacus]|uniref:ABC transporter ATP-binding protein n=1 Tax=Pseudidiomarina salilacus TaxID=3384452 RepID=UPI003984980F
MVTIENLGLTPRLQPISCRLSGSQLVGIIGPNGAGKSTLLNLLAGQLPATQGRVEFGGDNWLDSSALQRRQSLSFMPQQPHADGALTVATVLQVGLVNLRLSTPVTAEIARVTELLELQPLLQRPMASLSGGEQRRVHLARALLGDLPWLVLDEPIASLDIHYQLQMMELLRAQARTGKLVMVALHDLSLAARFCDALLLLDQGALRAVGEPAEVLSDENLAAAFRIQARWLCTEQGVGWLPQLLRDAD